MTGGNETPRGMVVFSVNSAFVLRTSNATNGRWKYDREETIQVKT